MNLNSKFLIFIGFLCIFFTQFFLITDVPGLHFDEAWQGLFAHQISTISGFWPTEAMNSYTSPVIHYFLAVIFKIFRTSVESMRYSLSCLNILTASLIYLWILKFLKNINAATLFLFLWSFLPLSVWNHHFFIELTTLHPFLFALLLWSYAFLNTKPKLASSLFVFCMVLGIYSHIAFLANLLLVLALVHYYDFSQIHFSRIRSALTVTIALILPLLFRIYFNTKKSSVLLITVFLLFFILNLFFKKLSLIKISSLMKPVSKIIVLPVLIIFALLHFSGIWPTSAFFGVNPLTLPVALPWIFFNLLLFSIWIFLEQKKPSIYFISFVLLFSITFILVLKPSPRFMLTPSLILMIGMAITFSEKLEQAKMKTLLLGFLALNLSSYFQVIQHFQTFGTNDVDFSIFGYRESGRDFRPFHKVLPWLKNNHCLSTLSWVENDRFKHPLEFYKLSHPQDFESTSTLCPYKSEDLFFSHIPNLNADAVPTPQVSLLYTQKSWGDLAFFLRKKDH